jgi:hypothetical protein
MTQFNFLLGSKPARVNEFTPLDEDELYDATDDEETPRGIILSRME